MNTGKEERMQDLRLQELNRTRKKRRNKHNECKGAELENASTAFGKLLEHVQIRNASATRQEELNTSKNLREDAQHRGRMFAQIDETQAMERRCARNPRFEEG